MSGGSSTVHLQPIGDSSGAGGLQGLGIWRYRTAITSNPAAGQLQFDNVLIDSATELYINEINDDGTDMSVFLALIESGDLLYIQVQADASEFVVLQVGASTNAAGVYTFPITAVEGQGSTPTNNTRVAVVTTAAGSGAATTLQQAYEAAVTPAQITINATPDPLTIDASVVGDVFAVRDVIDQDLLRLSTTGGSIAGGSNAGNILTLEGALAGSADTGIVRVNSPLDLAYNTIDNTTPAQAFAMDWGPTFTASAAYIGGALTVHPTVTVTTAVFIPATFSDTSNIMVAATPGFSAFTFINELAVIRNSGNFNLPSALVMNIGLTHERNTSGTSTTPGTTGISFSPQTRANVSGAVMTKTDQTAVRCSPTFSTVSGATTNLGTIRGLHIFNPAVALFQPAAGVETATAIIGVDVNALGFGGNIIKAAVRSAIAPGGSNSYFLLNNGNAHSDHGLGHIYFDDNAGIAYGGIGTAAFDVWQTWNASGYFRTFFNTAFADEMRWSNPDEGRILFDSNNGSTSGEYTFNCARFSLGAQSGANGNQIGNFVAPADTVTIGGEYSQFLLTQAGNVTVNANINAFGWTINAPAFTAGTGTLTTAAALNVGGNPNLATTNRVGVRIISNPSGGSGVNAALWVTAGLSRFDGRVDINQPIALGGGAAATLGTIGGTGPTAAAQAQWVEIDINGVSHWIPAWT